VPVRWLGVKVHDGIAELAGVGRGIESSGRAIAGTAHDVTGAVGGAFDSAGVAVLGATSGCSRRSPRTPA
jgi:hypothetical protein